MDRREWLKKAAILATGVIAADELELLDRLGWKRTLFPGASFGPPYLYTIGFSVTQEMLDDDWYAIYALPKTRPIKFDVAGPGTTALFVESV